MDEEISFPFHFSFQRQNSLSISKQGPALGQDWVTNALCRGAGSVASPPPTPPGMAGMLQGECSGALGAAQVHIHTGGDSPASLMDHSLWTNPKCRHQVHPSNLCLVPLGFPHPLLHHVWHGVAPRSQLQVLFRRNFTLCKVQPLPLQARRLGQLGSFTSQQSPPGQDSVPLSHSR